MGYITLYSFWMTEEGFQEMMKQCMKQGWKIKYTLKTDPHRIMTECVPKSTCPDSPHQHGSLFYDDHAEVYIATADIVELRVFVA